MIINLNQELITQRMRDLGLSERKVISQSGLPNFTFRRARQTGAVDASLTLRQLTNLATTLGVPTTDLLTPTPTPTAREPEQAIDQNSEQPRPGQPQHDAAILIPLLIDLPKMIPIAHIARSLEWPRPRTQTALDAIPTALTGTGLRLHTNNGNVRITPADPTNKTIKKALGRVRANVTGITVMEAKVLTRALNGEHVLDRQPSNPQRVAAGALTNMGCLTLNPAQVPEPSADLCFALPDL